MWINWNVHFRWLRYETGFCSQQGTIFLYSASIHAHCKNFLQFVLSLTYMFPAKGSNNIIHCFTFFLYQSHYCPHIVLNATDFFIKFGMSSSPNLLACLHILLILLIYKTYNTVFSLLLWWGKHNPFLWISLSRAGC